MLSFRAGSKNLDSQSAAHVKLQPVVLQSLSSAEEIAVELTPVVGGFLKVVLLVVDLAEIEDDGVLLLPAASAKEVFQESLALFVFPTEKPGGRSTFCALVVFVGRRIEGREVGVSAIPSLVCFELANIHREKIRHEG